MRKMTTFERDLTIAREQAITRMLAARTAKLREAIIARYR